MAELNFALIAKHLSSLSDEKKYAAFLREQSLAKDHTFLLRAISRSNLRPAEREVLEELVRFGKIRRPKHRPTADNKDIAGLYRALRVLDLEADGWGGKHYAAERRGAAITEASKQLNWSYSTIEKAVNKYEKILKAAPPDLLDRIRAFK